MNWLKQNWGKMVLFILALAYSFFDSWFWMVVFLFCLLIKFLLYKKFSKKILLILMITIWTLFVSITALGWYANRYFSHGPIYPTGDVICRNDDKGPCEEGYREDMTNLDIPSWVKLLRGSEADLTWMGVLFLAIVISSKYNGDI